MKLKYITFLLVIGLFACKSQYEQLRTSNDPERILTASLQYYDQEEYLKAQTLFEQIIPFYRGKELAEELYFKFAYTHYYMKDYMLSAHYFKSFTTTYYNSPKKEEAAFMSAYSNYRLSPNFRLDQTSSQTAIADLQTFINTYPSSPRVDEANQLIDEMRSKMEEKAFHQGKLYYDLKNYNSAITSFEGMLKDFPETQRAQEVRFLILDSSYDWAIKSVYDKREERLLSTIELAEKFKNKYPASPYAGNVMDIINKCTKDLKRFEND